MFSKKEYSNEYLSKKKDLEAIENSLHILNETLENAKMNLAGSTSIQDIENAYYRGELCKDDAIDKCNSIKALQQIVLSCPRLIKKTEAMLENYTAELNMIEPFSKCTIAGVPSDETFDSQSDKIFVTSSKKIVKTKKHSRLETFFMVTTIIFMCLSVHLNIQLSYGNNEIERLINEKHLMAKELSDSKGYYDFIQYKEEGYKILSDDLFPVYITPTGSKYHREGCQYLSLSSEEISIEEATNSGYEPCSKCNP